MIETVTRDGCCRSGATSVRRRKEPRVSGPFERHRHCRVTAHAARIADLTLGFCTRHESGFPVVHEVVSRRGGGGPKNPRRIYTKALEQPLLRLRGSLPEAT